MSQEDVARAKRDLEAVGQTWRTDCDAFRITNLVALRLGLKLVAKPDGVNCKGCKVDGIIDAANGVWLDVLVNGGPPNNGNVPAWQVQGPASAVQPHDPFPDEVHPPEPTPVPPDALAQITWLCTITYNQTVMNGHDLAAIKAKLGI